MAGTPIYYVTTPTGSYMIPKGSSGGSASTPQEAVDIVQKAEYDAGILTTPKEQAVSGLSPKALGTFASRASAGQTRDLLKDTRLNINASTSIQPTPSKFIAPERLPDENPSEYQARVMREEIAYDAIQPRTIPTSAELGLGLYREWGVPQSDLNIEGYEGLEKPIQTINPTYSRIKGALYKKGFLAEVKDIRESESLGAKVPIKKKIRIELLKLAPAFIASAGIGGIAGAGYSLLPSAVKAMKIRMALIGIIPAGYGAVKAVQNKEYGILAGGTAGGIYGFSRGYKYGGSTIKPYLQSRFSPLKVSGLSQSIVSPLESGKLLVDTKTQFTAKIGKKTYGGKAETITGLKPSTLIKSNKLKILNYQAESTATIGKWNTKNLYKFSAQTGYKVKDIKGMVKSGRLTRDSFISYTKPSKSKALGSVRLGKDEFFTYGIQRGKEITGGLGYGKTYARTPKVTYSKSITRYWKPKAKSYQPRAEFNIDQQVLFKPKFKPKDTGIGGGLFQQQTPRTVLAPNVKNIVNKVTAGAVTKAVRSKYKVDLKADFKQTKQVIPVITKSKSLPTFTRQPTRSITKQAPQATIVKQKRRQISGLIPLSKSRTSIKNKYSTATSMDILSGQKSKQKQLLAVATTHQSGLKQRQRQILRTPTRQVPTTTPLPYGSPPPPKIPFLPMFSLGTSSSNSMGRVPTRAKFGYLPSFKALAFKQFGTPTKKKKYSGLEYRPIPKGFSFQKYRKGKGGMF